MAIAHRLQHNMRLADTVIFGEDHDLAACHVPNDKSQFDAVTSGRRGSFHCEASLKNSEP